VSKDKKSKALALSTDGLSEDGARTLKALVLRREGVGFEEIGERLDCSPWEAKQLTSIAYSRLSAQLADELRAQVEDRLDDVTRRLYDDLRIASSQTVRNGIYGLLLKTESQRTRLLGLDIPAGTPDAPIEGTIDA